MEKYTSSAQIDLFEHLYQTEDQTVTHLQMKAGKEIGEHDTPFRAFIIPIKGKVSFSTPEKTVEIQPGDIIHLEPMEPHWLSAIDDSDVMVVKVKA